MNAIVAAVAPKLISAFAGKLFGGKPKAQGVDYVKLRDDATKAGFNPLTALMAGGGAGYQRQFDPSLSSGAFIADAVERGLDTAFNQPSGEDRELEALRKRAERVELERTINGMKVPGSFGYSLTKVAPFRPDAENLGVPSGAPLSKIRPPVSPRERAPERIPMFDQFGSPIQVMKSTADRLGLKAWDSLAAGEAAELFGEIAEAENAAGIDNLNEYQAGRNWLFGNGPKRPAKNLANPAPKKPRLHPGRKTDWQKQHGLFRHAPL